MIVKNCGGKAYHAIGDRNTRMYDRVQCLDCCLEMEGDYEPYSAVIPWNKRVGEDE